MVNKTQIEARLNTLFDTIVSYKRENDGASPTIRFLCHSLDIESTSLVWFYLHKLEGMGRIRFGDGRRNIIIPGGHWEIDTDLHQSTAELPAREG